MSPKRIAIIGSGISGLGCAHFLHQHHEVTVFEADSRIGGHSNTVEFEEEGQSLAVDTGFMVFNHQTYPHLCRLFDQLGVLTKRTDMSFSLHHGPSGREYNGHSLNTIFGQRRQAFSPRFWSFLLQIDRFNKETVAAMDDPAFAEMSLGDYVQHRGYGEDFLQWYILPMGSAVWSAPPQRMMEFPARTLMQFWFNHGFLGMRSRHPWWTVVDGSRQYVRKLSAPFADRIHTRSAIRRVSGSSGAWILHLDGGQAGSFDHVIFACHAPTTLSMLEDASDLEREVLSKFLYQANAAVLHSDDQFMPKTRRCWASWNYRLDSSAEGGALVPSTHYWMNSLQGVSQRRQYFVSINPPSSLDPSKVISRLEYEHPLFDVAAMRAQSQVPLLNGKSGASGRWFCGAWTRYGFHEDGLISAVQVCQALTGVDPWSLC